MRLSDLLEGAGIDNASVLNFCDIEISGICPDSRRVKDGELFIALDGERVDGSRFVAKAIENGAIAALVSKNALEDGRISSEGINIPLIVSNDTRADMSYLYSAFYGHPQRKMKLIGVTGTNGKTSVSSLIRAILSGSGKKCGLIGTLGCFSPSGRLEIRSADENANMTTPDPEELYRILDIMQKDGAEYVCMEVSSHSLHYRKVSPITFEVGVFTNLTPDHLDLHGTMENYFQAKMSLFDSCLNAVINYDDYYGRILAENIKNNRNNKKIRAEKHFLCTCEGRECSCFAEDIHCLGSGIEYRLTGADMRLRIRSPLCGDYNVKNTMQAAIACRVLGVSPKDIKDSLATLSSIDGRLERVRLGSRVNFSVYIDYAHTPDALENLLRCARGFSGSGRIVLLFGCGGERDRQKRPLMGHIATEMADMVIITSDNCRSEAKEDIISDILSGIESRAQASYTVIPDREDAIEYAVRNARAGDVILLAGKGHESYLIDEKGKHYFSEKEILLRAIEKYF